MKRMFVIVFSALLCLATVTPASAAFDYFLRLDGIDGASTIKGYEKWIEVESYRLAGANTAPPGTEDVTGQVEFEDFSFTKLLDAASPGIFQSFVTAKHIKSGQLDIVLSSEKPSKAFSYSFTDILFTRLEHSGAEPELPLEFAAFRFDKIKLQSFLKDPKGGTIAGASVEYDLKNAALVPEPSTWLSLLAGLAILAGSRAVSSRRHAGHRIA